jgi:hypothetical protein
LAKVCIAFGRQDRLSFGSFYTARVINGPS